MLRDPIHNRILSSTPPGGRVYLDRDTYDLQFSFKYLGDEIDILYESQWLAPTTGWQLSPKWKMVFSSVYVNGKKYRHIEHTPYTWHLDSSIENVNNDQLLGNILCTLFRQGKIINQQRAVFPKQPNLKRLPWIFRIEKQIADCLVLTLFVFLWIFFLYPITWLLEAFSITRHDSPSDFIHYVISTIEMITSALITIRFIKFIGITAFLNSKRRPNLPYIEVESVKTQFEQE